MNLSRRDFLKLVGLSVSGRQLAPTLHLNQAVPSGMGRLFDATSLYRWPNIISSTPHILWPDSVHQLLGVMGDWVQIDGGYIPKTAIQPMLEANYPHPTQIEQPLFVEVVAPSAAIRSYADGAAPVCTTLGHGGLLRVDYGLQDDHGAWWLRSGQGWLQAAHVQPVVAEATITQHHLQLVLDRRQHAVFVQTDDQQVKLAACFPPESIYTAAIRPLSLDVADTWTLELADHTLLQGTFRHNDLGTGRLAPAGRVELSVVAARWLYQQVMNAKTVRVSLRT